jgi:nitric oxide synthase oxygenase domain/subunit
MSPAKIDPTVSIFQPETEIAILNMQHFLYIYAASTGTEIVSDGLWPID